MILACGWCGGILESGGAVVIMGFVTAAITNWYNRRQCRTWHCYHNCKKRK